MQGVVGVSSAVAAGESGTTGGKVGAGGGP